VLLLQMRVRYHSVDPILRLLRERPALTFDRPYAGYLLFLFGQSDEAIATWFSRNLVALDSLTGSTIAGVVFADRVRIRVAVEQGRHHPLNTEEVPIDEIQSGYQADYRYERLVSDDGKSSFSGEAEVTAVTYAADEVARVMNLTSDLPCIVILDAIPSGEIEVLRLGANDPTTTIIAILRDLVSEFRSKDRYRRFFELLERIHDTDEEIKDLNVKAATARKNCAATRGTSVPERLSWPPKAKAALIADNLRDFRSALQAAPAELRTRMLSNLKADGRNLAGLAKTIGTLQYYCRRWPLSEDEHARLRNILCNHASAYVSATGINTRCVEEVEATVAQLAEAQQNLQARYLAELPDISKEFSDFVESIDEQATRWEAEANLREVEVQEKDHEQAQLLEELKQCEIPRLQEAFRRLASRRGIQVKTKTYRAAVADWIGGFLKPEMVIKIAEVLGKSFGHHPG